jgi:hypothetical protein
MTLEMIAAPRHALTMFPFDPFDMAQEFHHPHGYDQG